jgi:ribosomal protein L40E
MKPKANYLQIKYCVDCGKKIGYRAKRCRKCSTILLNRKHLIGTYIDGRSLKKYYCKHCGIKISNYQHKLCPQCAVIAKTCFIPKDKLSKYYIIKKWSANKIAKKFHCSKAPILKLLKTYDIPVRNNSEAKIGLKMGNKAWNWKGRISREYIGFNDCLKEKIRTRDNHQCQICFQNIEPGKLDVHHKDLIRKNNNESNLISLCE